MEEPRCTECAQREKGLFCNLAVDHIRKLDQVKSIERYRAGQAIFYEGQKPRALFCIYSGRVKVFKMGARGEEQLIRILGPADLLGYRPILAGEPCAATSEAIEPATICAFPPQILGEMVRESSDFASLLLARLARELRVSEDSLVIVAQLPARQRTAHVLLQLQALGNQEAGSRARPVVELKRSEIAQIVATTPETISRVLHDLAQKGIVRLTRTGITIADPVALRRIATGSRRPS